MLARLTIWFALLTAGLGPAAAMDRPPRNDPGEAKSCGGFGGLRCGTGEWCDFRRTCGAHDQLGICRPRPEACAQIYQPVCGCDGKTYGNACTAQAAGIDVAESGACPSDG